jgi:3-phenylpropionate/cinnamic acid dioxygenase small subunit
VAATFEDWHAVNSLVLRYAELLDAARFSEVAAMFEHATYRIEHTGVDHVSVYRGVGEVLAFCEQTRVFEDGTPRTRHVVTNVDIQIEGDVARARSYATVFQQTPELPLQPIASGTYADTFARVGSVWRFADRTIKGFLLGDRSQHVAWHDGAPR